MRRNTTHLLFAIVGLLSTLECTTYAFFSAPTCSALREARHPTIRPQHHSSNDDHHSSNDDWLYGIEKHVKQSIATILTSAALFTSVLTSPFNVHITSRTNTADIHNSNNNNIISIQRSDAYALTENQQFVADTWFAVSAQYFDQSFNGLGEDGWRAKEKEAIAKVEDTGPDDDEIVTNAINNMLSALDDPYTRFLPREKYETLTNYATGKSGNNAGIGVQLLEDPRTKNVIVMATTNGSPASAANIQVGDAIVKVNGESMQGASAEVVAYKCKGEAGGKVELDLLHKNDNGKESTQHISITRAKITPNPIEASTFATAGGKNIGLLRIPSFSTETVSQLIDGIRSVSKDGNVDAVAIDIRGNVGGYMPAGVDAAKLFLPARAHIIAEVGKPGSPPKTYDADGIGAETSLPVYLLVDKRTASASEIFAAALQDNDRATVVGNTNTFGKGRIQNVQPLENGAGIAVTRARYVTPRGRDLHGVGIIPNFKPVNQCEAKDSAKTCLEGIV